jgi:hypothetical protein
MVSEDGVTVREKSGAGGGGGGAVAVVVTTIVAVCVNVPEIPVRVAVAVPLDTVLSALNVMFCGVPAVRVRAAGLVVTPDGSPLNVTGTCAVKPFAAVAVTLTGWLAAPPATETVVGDTASEKSAAEGAEG